MSHKEAQEVDAKRHTRSPEYPYVFVPLVPFCASCASL
jgi:hypothetical protein